jgi:hypothetical protein
MASPFIAASSYRCFTGGDTMNNQNPLSQDTTQESLNTSIAMLEYLASTFPVKPNSQKVEDSDEPLKYLTSGEIPGYGIVFIAFGVCLKMLMRNC